MPDSLRETGMKALKAALEVGQVDWHGELTTKPSGLNVHRHFTRGPADSELPDITVFYIGEDLEHEMKGSTDESLRRVRFGLRVRVKAPAGETGDEALDPLLVWAEIAVLTDYSLGGLFSNARLEGIDAISAREVADTYAEATMQFVHTLQTKWGDPRQAP